MVTLKDDKEIVAVMYDLGYVKKKPGPRIGNEPILFLKKIPNFTLKFTSA